MSAALFDLLHGPLATEGKLTLSHSQKAKSSNDGISWNATASRGKSGMSTIRFR